MHNTKKYRILSVLLVVQWLVIQLISKSPDFVENYYSTGIYPYISRFFRFLFGWIPFSFGDVIYIVLSVLGAMMIDKKGVDDVIDILNPETFYVPAHQEVYRAIYTLFQNSEPIDLRTVSNQLRKNGKLEFVGGDFYLIGLTQKVASTAHIEFHSRIILQKFIQRKLITISSEIIQEAYDETVDVFDLLDACLLYTSDAADE